MAGDIKEYLTPPVLLIIFLLAISLMFIFPVLNMIILGAILAYLVKPVSLKIQSKIRFSNVSILLAMVIVLIPLVLLIAYIVYVISGFISGVLISNSNVDLLAVINQFAVYLPIDANSINSSITEIAKYVLSYLVKFASKFLNITLDLFVLICSVFYFVRDGDNCIEFVKSFVPDDSKDFFDSTVESVKDVLRSIFYGHFLTSLIIGVFGCIG